MVCSQRETCGENRWMREATWRLHMLGNYIHASKPLIDWVIDAFRRHTVMLNYLNMLGEGPKVIVPATRVFAGFLTTWMHNSIYCLIQ